MTPRSTSAAAGYSGTPLVRKPRHKPGFVAARLDAPDAFGGLLVGLPDDVRVRTQPRGRVGLAVCFLKLVIRKELR